MPQPHPFSRLKSEDPPTEEEKPIEKGNSLPARTKKKKKKPKTNIIDDWKEKNKEENKMTKKLLEAETREKAWQSEKVELMAKLRDSESRFSNSFPEASRQPLPFGRSPSALSLCLFSFSLV